MTATEALGRNVRAGRSLRGMRKQRDSATAMNRLGHKWTDVTVSFVERGKRKVDVDELASLALVLGYVVGDLLVPPETERLDVGAITMRPGFVHAWGRGDRVVLLTWDEEKATWGTPSILARRGAQSDFDTQITDIELRNP